MFTWVEKHGWRVAIAALILAIAIAGSDHHGVPKTLPSTALGWRLLFHVERALVLLAAIGAVLLVGWRALHGEFPDRFGQLQYPVREAVAKVGDATDAQELRLQIIEGKLGIAPPPDV